MESPQRRWRIAWLLALGVLVNYFDRVNLSVSHDALFVAFGLTNFGFGILSGAYNWTYAACQLPIGILLDRFGIRRIGRISTFVWSLASFGAALSPSLGGFFGARLLLGVGEAPTFPANAKAIGLWFPEKERGFATSLNDAAAKFASAIGVPLLGVVLLQGRLAVEFCRDGVHQSRVFSAVLAGISRSGGRPAAQPDGASIHSGECRAHRYAKAVNRRRWDTCLRQRKVLGLALGFGSYNYVFYLLLTWLPSYLSSALNIDLLHSFLYTGVPWLFATLTDLSGGWLSDRLICMGYDASRVRKSFLVCGLACGMGILGAADAHTASRALIWISISLGGLAAAAPVGWSVPSMIAPRGGVGTVGGIVNFSNQLSGIAAPFITGWIVSITHSYAWAFIAAAIYLLLGIASYIFLLGRIERIPQERASLI